MLVDSHMHFDTFEKEGVVDAILERAGQAGVQQVVSIGGSPDANRLAVTLAKRYPGVVYGTVGYDRDLATQPYSLEEVESLATMPGVVGIGETGLDYHYEPELKREQQSLMSDMLSLAARQRLPVVVHSRDADADTLALLGEHGRKWEGEPGRLGVLHCFTGDRAFAEGLVEMNYLISFSGIITFKNAESLREVARWVPDEHLLVETDAPYLAPVPYRGKTNEPAWVAQVAECLAEIRHDTPEHIADITTCNARRLFGLD